MLIAALALLALQDPQVVDGVIVRPDWLETPTAEQLQPDDGGRTEYNPTGRVDLTCVVLADGRMHDCRIAALSTAYPELGSKAFEASRYFRIQPRLRDGAPTAGMKARIVFRWNPPLD